MIAEKSNNCKKKIAVIGLACRFPGADNYNEYWDNISQGIDSVKEIDEDRWNTEEFYSNDPDEKNKSISKWSGLINDFRYFDARFFNISPKEANSMDPQQRILLEEVYHCIENSGVNPEELRKKKTDVYVGVVNTGYDVFAMQAETELTSYANSGIYDCITANRISYYFGLTGNSVALNTGCSGSLVALHHAIEALRSNSCDYAIVAGVNVATMLVKYISGSKAHLLSPTGSCKTFDKDADGYVPGEGAGVVLLQRLDDAVSDNNSISVILRGSSVNHVGTSVSLNSPSIASQKELIKAAIADADVEPEQIGYIEAHGTGTSLGDPIEVEALKQTFETYTEKKHFCHLGSVKANIGHLEAASGIASLIKVIMMMKHNLIPPQIHFNVLNPVIQLDNSPFAISKENIAWRPNPGYNSLMAGISSFGFGGSNAHVIVEQYNSAKIKKNVGSKAKLPFVISAKSQESLEELKKQFNISLNEIQSNYKLYDVCKTLICGREHYKYRLFSYVTGWKDIENALCTHENVECYAPMLSSEAICIDLCTKNDVDKAETIIRKSSFSQNIFDSVTSKAAEILQILKQKAEGNIKSKLRRFIVEYSLTEALIRAGVSPDLIIAGKDSFITALCITDSIDLDEAIKLICCEKKVGENKINRPRIPCYCLETKKAISPYISKDDFFESALEFDIPDEYVEKYWQRANNLYGTQYTFTKIIDRWIEDYKNISGKKIVFSKDALDSMDADEKRIWFVSIVSSIIQVSQKWSLPFDELKISKALNDLIKMSVNKVIDSKICISFLLGDKNARDHINSLISNGELKYSSEYKYLNEQQLDPAEINSVFNDDTSCSTIDLSVYSIICFSKSIEISEGNTVFSEDYKEFEDFIGVLYKRGANIAWNKIYPDADYNKCKLINYPFVHDKKYWISPCNFTRNNSTNGIITESVSATEISHDNKEELDEYSCVFDFLNNELKDILGISDSIHPDDLFSELGVDSIAINAFNQSMQSKIGDISEMSLYRTKTLKELTELFVNDYPEYVSKIVEGHNSKNNNIERNFSPIKENQTEIFSETNDNSSCDEIAIIGMSGRFSDCEDLDEFWNGLVEGKNFITEIPKDRWDYEKIFSNDIRESKNNKIYCKYGSFMKNVDKFDPLFFKIMPNEAERMDPQERVFLQTAWHTLEDAGYGNLKIVDRSKIGVFVGVTTNTYAMIGEKERIKGNYVYPNSRPWSIANRVSYLLDLKGTSIAVDTACASSLTSLHMACSSILNGECKMAIAGGVNMYLHSSRYVELCQLHMLSATGRCHTFDAKADGFVPGEGCGAVLLKPLRDAERDHDHIYAVIKSTAINHTGLTGGYAVPSAQSQTEVIHAALEKANISARTISAVEAHGTGTKLGDPLEILGLTAAFTKDTSDKNYCSISSVKSNIGHCEGAAGIASIIKAVLELKNKKLIPIYGLNEINHEINFDDTPFIPQRELKDWQKMEVPSINGGKETVPRRIEISCMGAGGVNVAAILEEYNNVISKSSENTSDCLLILSANTQKSLIKYAENVLNFIRNNKTSDISRILYTFQIGRKAMPFRLALTAYSENELESKLERFICNQSSDESNNIYYNKVSKNVTADTSSSAQDISALIRDKKLDLLGKYWCEGIDSIDWKLLYRDNITKISVPVYPFDEERYWVKILEDPTEEEISVTNINTIVKTEKAVSDIDQNKIYNEIIEIISSLTGLSADKIDLNSNFSDYGFDSIVLNDFADTVNTRYNSNISPTIFFTYDQIKEFIDYLIKENPAIIHSSLPTTISTNNEEISNRYLTKDDVKNSVLDAISSITKISVENIDIYSSISDYGFDSITLGDLADDLSARLNCTISPSSFFNKNVISDYIDYIIEEYKPCEVNAPVIKSETINESIKSEIVLTSETKKDKIAIVGISAILPQADNIEEYWDNLIKNINCSEKVKAERWIGELPEDKVLLGGFVKNAFSFDTKFFHISPYEAEQMDPQQRKVIENVWHAIENSGHNITDFSKKRTGVFISTENCDYRDRIREYGTFDELTATGSAANMLANRISYLFDFNGPSEVIDTACSGSLSAINRAVDALWLGECDSAIVGGTRLILSPCGYTVCEKMGILSSTGKCSTFDESANGYVKGEGIGVLVLKPLATAEKDGDYIYGVIAGKAVNHGGKARSVTAPNAVAQSTLIYDAIKNSGLPLEKISYIETHGTGTKLGDSIEIEGLIKAFSSIAAEQGYNDANILNCGIGSVKPNIGHLENMSGIASVIKVLLAMKNKKIPATINFKKLNPLLNLDHTPFHIIDKNTAWNTSGQTVCAGVSSFGFGGSNVHIIFESYNNKSGNYNGKKYIYILSARDEKRLHDYAEEVIKYIDKNSESDKTPHIVTNKVPCMDNFDRIVDEIKHIISIFTGVTPDDIIADATFDENNVYDFMLSMLSDKINQLYDITISENDIAQHNTITTLSQYISDNFADKIRARFSGIKTLTTVEKEAVAKDKINFADFIYTSQIGRAEFNERIAIVTESFDDLKKKLQLYLEKSICDDIYTGTCNNRENAHLSDAEAEKMFRTAPGLLASLWCSGTVIPWKSIYGTCVMKRVAVPVYPFAKDEYVLDKSKSNNTNRISIVKNNVLNSYIDSNISTLDNTVFTKKYSINDDVIAQHIINGRCILPGAAHISMAYSSLQFALNGNVTGLEKISWLNPVYVDADKQLNVKIARNGDKIEYNVFSDNEFYSKGKLLNDKVTLNYDAISTLLNCCNKVDVNKLYNEFTSGGISYGERFRVIKEAYISTDKKQGYTRINANKMNSITDRYYIDAMLLDGIFQSTAIVTEECIKNSFIPFSIGKIQINRSIPEECIVLIYSKKDFGGQSFTFDIVVVDSEMNEIIKITDYCTRMI